MESASTSSLESPSNIPIPSPKSSEPLMQWRFNPVCGEVEWIEDYRPGGYHPVMLGDLFNGRYKVIRKLGYGGYSTVWLAQDLVESRNVALKILMSRVDSSREMEILATLSEHDPKHPGSKHVFTLLDHFQHTGPNGIHQCLVSEVLGPSIGDLLYKPWRKFGDSPRYDKSTIREIGRQGLLGLDYIHKAGIVHGDIYVGNILSVIHELDAETTSDVLRDVHEPVQSELVTRKDGLCPEGGDTWAPPRLYGSQPLYGTQDATRVDTSNLVIKLVDFGGAFRVDDTVATRPVTPFPIRAPERIVFDRGNLWDEKIDIWAMGYLILALVTHNSPIELWRGQDVDITDDDHILQLYDLLGPLPPSIAQTWTRYNQYFDSASGRQIRSSLIGYNDDNIDPGPSLKEFLWEYRPQDMSDVEAEDLFAMLGRMLRYNPTERASAQALLQEVWLNASRYES